MNDLSFLVKIIQDTQESEEADLDKKFPDETIHHSIPKNANSEAFKNSGEGPNTTIHKKIRRV